MMVLSGGGRRGRRDGREEGSGDSRGADGTGVGVGCAVGDAGSGTGETDGIEEGAVKRWLALSRAVSIRLTFAVALALVSAPVTVLEGCDTAGEEGNSPRVFIPLLLHLGDCLIYASAPLMCLNSPALAVHLAACR